MANRSYLYSVDKIPSPANKNISIKGLSEWNYAIPLSFLTLVSGNTQLCHSIIFESSEKVSLIGDYKEGLENVKKLFSLFRENDLEESQEFEKLVGKTLEFLDSEKHKQKYILLEQTELLMMDGDITQEEAAKALQDLRTIKQAIDNSDFVGLNVFLGGNLKKQWREILGIDNWSDVLYYHFK